jgi:hydrogenase/urease accessory protein HupE
MSYSDVQVSADHRELVYQLRMNVADTAEPLGLAADTTPTDDQLRAASARVFDYVLDHITIDTGGQACAIERLGLTILHQTDRFAELSWRLRCPQPLTALIIDYQLFFAIDPLHTGNLKVTVPGADVAVTPLTEDHSRFVWDDLGEPPPSGLAAFVRSGVAHILHGYDHVAFLLGLLLVVAITRRGEREWRPRRVIPAIRYTAVIVTSFTIAHSLTLIAAALGWISLSPAIVETAIAASIIYIAIENTLRPDTRYRWALTFAFGLVHGLGFASVLSHQLPPDQIILPLLAFNVGVELGQLVLVVTVVPLLQITAHRILGAPRYRTWLVPIGSLLIGALGFLWLIERLFGVEILGF